MADIFITEDDYNLLTEDDNQLIPEDDLIIDLSAYILAEDDNNLVTEDGDRLITEGTVVASVAEWPDIAEPLFPLKESTEFPTLRSDKDGSYLVMRKRWTQMKKTFQLDWDEKVSLTEIDYQLLEAFFLVKQGDKFTWQHPATDVVYTVMFDQDSLESTIIFPGFRSLSVRLRQQ